MVTLRYEPYRPDRSPHELIIVGGSAPAALHLSHWPGNATPPALRADTSLEISLKFLNLKTPRREEVRRGAAVATSPRFSVDALLAVWALVAPHRAQGFTGPLQAAAFSGEYQVYVIPEATKICCALMRLADPERSPLRPELGGPDPWERVGARYRALLPLLDDLLGYVDRFEGDWRDEFQGIQADRELLARGQASLEEFPEVDLAVVRAPRALHPVARNSATDRLRVLTIVGETNYEMTYRAESWVDFTSRPVAPRIDLGPLLPELQTLETGSTWRWDGIAGPVPSLRCVDAAGRPAPSAIAPDRLIALLRRYLASHAQSTALHWNPRARGPDIEAGSSR
jgi:hypothetical protein